MAQTRTFLKILSAYCILSYCKVWKKNKADPEVYYQLSCFKSLKKIFSIYLEIKFWYNNPAKISHLSQKRTFEKISITDFYQPLCLVMPQNLKKIGSWNLSLHNFGPHSHTKNQTITIFWGFARNYFYLLIGATILQSLKKTLRLNPRKLNKVEKSLQTQRHINKLTTESPSI